MLESDTGLRREIIVQESYSASWNHFASELVKVDSTDTFLVFDNDCIVIEDENVVIRSILHIKQVLTFDPVSIGVLPVARHTVLIWLGSLCLVQSYHDNCISIQRLKELI